MTDLKDMNDINGDDDTTNDYTDAFARQDDTWMYHGANWVICYEMFIFSTRNNNSVDSIRYISRSF